MLPTAVSEFIDSARPGRGELIEAVHRVVQECAPELSVEHKNGFLGYGPYRYRYESGREGETYVVSIRDGAAALSLYIMGGNGQEYLVESYAEQLGKVSVGKSCIRVKRLEHLDLDVLETVIREAREQHREATAAYKEQ